jgi:NADPH:quinone reductase
MPPMRALVPTEADAPSVRFAEVDEPQSGADEVVVAVEAFSVNRGETFLLESPAPGWRPGKDVAGTVVQAAASGKGPAVGERVLGHPESAGWAERVAVPVCKVAALPDGVRTQDAAALPLAGLTALRLLRATGNLASRRVLLTGASGGVGHYFVELAAAQGADISAVCSTEERGARLLDLGAREALVEIEDAEGRFDVGLDSVGGASTAAVLRRLNEDGLLIWFGQASRTPPALDFFDWTGGMNVTIRKFHYANGEFSDAADLTTLARLVARGQLHPQIGLAENWDCTQAAIDALLARKVRGNAVLTLGTG